MPEFELWCIVVCVLGFRRVWSYVTRLWCGLWQILHYVVLEDCTSWRRQWHNDWPPWHVPTKSITVIIVVVITGESPTLSPASAWPILIHTSSSKHCQQRSVWPCLLDRCGSVVQSLVLPTKVCLSLYAWQVWLSGLVVRTANKRLSELVCLTGVARWFSR